MRQIGSLSLAPRLIAAVLVGSLASTSFVPAVFAQGAAAPTAAPAPAKEPTAQEKKKARDAYTKGESAFKQGDFPMAEEGYREANSIIPTPQAAYWIAKAIDQQNHRIADAIAAYSAFLADPGHARAGEERVKDAQARLEALKKTPGEYVLNTTPPGAKITVDGQVQLGQTPQRLTLPPGKRIIQVELEGYDPQVLEVEMGPGGKLEENVALVQAAPPEPAAPVLPPEPPPVQVEPAPAPEPEEKSNLPAYITLGIAGASAIVGTIFGIQALSAKSDYDSTPTNDLADDVERNALISDMAFGVAITLGITGIVLLTTGNDDPMAASKKQRNQGWANLQVAPYVSKEGGGAAAQFRF